MWYIPKYLKLCHELLYMWTVTDLPQCRSLIWKEVWENEVDLSWPLSVDLEGKTGDYWNHEYLAS